MCFLWWVIFFYLLNITQILGWQQYNMALVRSTEVEHLAWHLIDRKTYLSILINITSHAWGYRSYNVPWRITRAQLELFLIWMRMYSSRLIVVLFLHFRYASKYITTMIILFLQTFLIFCKIYYFLFAKLNFASNLNKQSKYIYDSNFVMSSLKYVNNTIKNFNLNSGIWRTKYISGI